MNEVSVIHSLADISTSLNCPGALGFAVRLWLYCTKTA